MKFLSKSNFWISRISALIFQFSKNVFIWSKYIILQITKKKILSRLILSVYSVNRSSSGLWFFDHSILWWLKSVGQEIGQIQTRTRTTNKRNMKSQVFISKFRTNSRWISRSNTIKVAVNWPLTLKWVGFLALFGSFCWFDKSFC